MLVHRMRMRARAFHVSRAASNSAPPSGGLRPEDVKSGYMKRKLARQQALTVRQEAPPPATEAPPPPAWEQYQEPTFGQRMRANFVSGIGLALGVTIVMVVLRSIGLDGAFPSAEELHAAEQAFAEEEQQQQQHGHQHQQRLQ